jgi:single-strand DNA-binding protein
MNCWMGCGRLGANIDLRYTPGGHALARVLLAVDRYGKDGKKGTDWIRLVLWGRTAENAARFVGKGSKVTVMGRVSSEFWERETDDGKKSQLTTEIVVEHIEFNGAPMFRPQPGAGQPADEPQRRGKAA